MNSIDVSERPLASVVTGAQLAHDRDLCVLYEDNVKFRGAVEVAAASTRLDLRLPEIVIATVR